MQSNKTTLETRTTKRLRTYGADPKRWPDKHRAEIAKTIKTNVAARAQKNHEQSLDNWLDARMSNPHNASTLTATILASFVAHDPNPSVRERRPLSMLIAGALSMAACLLTGALAAPYILDITLGTETFITALEMTSIEIWSN